jgi:hypothetical protein
MSRGPRQTRRLGRRPRSAEGLSQGEAARRYGSPGGWVARFQQTLKNWLQVQSAILTELQALPGAFTVICNESCPRRPLPHHAVPDTAYAAHPKAIPGDRTADAHDRVRTDTDTDTDTDGKLTLRVNGNSTTSALAASMPAHPSSCSSTPPPANSSASWSSTPPATTSPPDVHLAPNQTPRTRWGFGVFPMSCNITVVGAEGFEPPKPPACKEWKPCTGLYAESL